MTGFTLKIIACITMFLDHVKFATPIAQNFVTKYFGRIAFPIFAFLVAEAYVHTSDLKKYIKRILIFGIISQIPFMFFRILTGDWLALNIMFTLLFGIGCIHVYEKIDKKYISIPIIILIIILGELVRVDYGAYGVLTVFVMYLFRNKRKLLIPVYATIVVVYYLSMVGVKYILNPEIITYMICVMIPIFLINFYNGKKGKSMKYFFYYFYPLHMLAIYIISLIV